ncbi:MAG: AAA family ATPase [Burkholderiales bacterium]
MSRRLTIDKLARTQTDGVTEELEFGTGVNVIVGPQNTGKSTWLRMLDYLMGETEAASEKFDEVLVRKYSAVSASMRLGDEAIEIERNWTQDGRRSQMNLNGERFAVADLQDLILDRLGIPSLRFPQGNVYASDRTWSTLGWRSLLRHIYRRQDFWGDFVPRQPESEQQACLLQFLGLAEHLFSEEFAALVDKQKQVMRLQSRKDYFVELTQQIAPDLIADKDLSVGITASSIEIARARVQQEIDDLIASREAILDKLQNDVAPANGELPHLMGERMATLHRRDGLKETHQQIDARLQELERYQLGLRQEHERLDRADCAAAIFDDLRVTHCPACDQSVEQRARVPDHCFLCGQSTPEAANLRTAAHRLKFEREQITAELAEASELCATAIAEKKRTQAELEETDQRLRELEASLRPFQTRVRRRAGGFGAHRSADRRAECEG